MTDKQSTSAQRKGARSWLVLALAAAITAGCTTVTTPSRPTADVQTLDRRARAAVEAQNYAAAADLYTQLASATSGSQRSEYLLTAARYAADYGDNALARRRVTEARPGATREQQQRITVLSARLELAEGRPQAAIDTLGTLLEPLSDTAREEAAAVRGQALFRLGQNVEAVRVLTEREVWLNDSASILANQHMIWDGFKLSPSTAAAPRVGDPIIDGWLALAPLAKLEPDALRRELLVWRQTYTDHPAARGILAEILAAQRPAVFPRQVALLLPLGAQQRAAALAIRDGFMAAYLGSGRHADTAVRVYDTAQLGAKEAYLRAQLEGADFIVGPLLRPEVDSVISQAGFMPTLALNFASTETPFSGSFYQFALSPEDEARAAAAAAATQGAKTAIVLVPSNTRGYQIRDAFQAAFAAYGGEVLDWTGYEPALQNFSQPISALLHVTMSTQRHRRLAANLGEAVQFEARRRQDVDMIFMVADNRVASLLTPQLRFFAANDIPTYATAEVFDPSNRDGNTDLNGLIFADAPLVLTPDAEAEGLRREVRTFWPQRLNQLKLFGMGRDAFELIGALYARDGIVWPVHGLSGDLSLDGQGRVHRALPLAQFRGGQPVALETAIEPPLVPPVQSGNLVGQR